MPLPKTPITLQGGCNCGAIRYKLEIPAYEERVLHPTVEEHRRDSRDAERFPFTVTCCCNDCRQATAGLFVGGICMPASMVTASCLSRTSDAARKAESTPFIGKTFGTDDKVSVDVKAREANGKLTGRYRDGEDEGNAGDGLSTTTTTEEKRPPYLAGMEVLLPGGEASQDTFVGFYHSSANRTRSFCQRCGTPISYNIWPMPAGLPDIIDIIMGSLDREDMEKIGEPDAQLWWNKGIDWVKGMIAGCQAPKYPGWRVDEKI